MGTALTAPSLGACSQPCLQTPCQTRSQKNRTRGSPRHGKLCYSMAFSPPTRKVFRAAYQKGLSCPIYSHILKVGSWHCKPPHTHTRTQTHKEPLQTHMATECTNGTIRDGDVQGEQESGADSGATWFHTLPWNEPCDALLPGFTSIPENQVRPFFNLLPRTEEKNQKLPLLLLMQAPKKVLVKVEKGTELREKKKKCGSEIG